MRLRINWPQFKSLAVVSTRSTTVALFIESYAQIVMCHPATGILCQRRRVQGDKILVDGSLSPRQNNKQQKQNSTDPKKRRFSHNGARHAGGLTRRMARCRWQHCKPPGHSQAATHMY